MRAGNLIVQKNSKDHLSVHLQSRKKNFLISLISLIFCVRYMNAGLISRFHLNSTEYLRDHLDRKIRDKKISYLYDLKSVIEM